MEALQRAKQKLEKEKVELRLEADDLSASVEQLSRAKVTHQNAASNAKIKLILESK